ncbi:MAG: small ribosomal subunit Rsm22 family protein, partial [Deltaproteobacteria bacterium]|nr:small ribosomal subunit Rsm22 family protein [Deltaproteobacteria bacterium]
SLHSQLKTRVIDFEREPVSRVLKGASFDLILMVNTLNEIRFDKRVRLIEQLLRGSLTSGGKILIIEPALQKTTRELMELHDHLLERKLAKVLAPCLHQHSCPMLREGQRDWCHTYLEWERPEMIAEFDHRIGIRKDYLKCSYLILEKKQENSLPEKLAGGPAPWRAVSSLMRSNGKNQLVLCGESGARDGRLLHTERLDSDRSRFNIPLDQAKRGDIFLMEPIQKITKETLIRKL